MRLHWLSIGILAVSTALLAQTYPQGPGPQGPQQPYPQGAPYPQGGPAPQGAPAPAQQGAAAPLDEPGRAVARLGILNGEASIRRGDSNDWVAAAVNAPLMSGDQISVAAGSRAEIQLDAAHFLRLAGDTEVRLADIENGHYQVQVSHGLMTWRVLRNTQAQVDISTPLVAVHPGPLSTVRVEVDGDGSSHVTVRHGEATVSTQAGSEKVAENSTMDIRGSQGDPEFQVVAAAARDEWDGWGDQRDTYLLRAQSQRYVQPEVSGVEDLDPYGHWVYDPAYGWVWMPTVATNWAPYQNGQWVWEDYYGWTWVDYAPWGWAPFHYGSWYFRGGLGWAWYPGPRVGRVWWRPALVGFFGWGGGIGIGVGFGFGNIGWVALAPHEVFNPWYGRGGFVNVNIVRNANVAGAFRNAGVANGVTAVSAVDFQRGNFRNTVPVDRATLQSASLVRGTVPMTPTTQNLRFSNRTATVTPGARAGASSQRFLGAATPASAARTPFAQQQTAVRSAMNGTSAVQSRAQSAGQAGFQNRGGPVGAGQSSAPGWQRFEGSSSASAGAAGARPATPANGLSGTPNGGTAANAAPRQFQVSPSIVRQRPDAAAPGSSQSYGGNTQQPRPQQPAAPQSSYGSYGQPQRTQQAPSAPSSAPARSAPAGGGASRSSGSRGSGRR